ncbi:peptidoglycan DD-metalloendopeptidase family protein [Neptuniibacter pectenicola]|uniref:Peptidoglycan DD-metalloendopeptidase family protein n=1 Tax=Neptuniibacter pectenicola TaxID=1806669 RepID=A0ABU9TQB6_9GAMM
MLLKWLLALTIAGMLVACGGPTYAPVSERTVPAASQHNPGQYTVRKGDTLYSIAFRYGMDYRQLAALNGVDSRYNIFPGQRLKLKSTTRTTSNESIVRESSTIAPKPIITSTRKTASSTHKTTPSKSTSSKTSTTAKPVSKPRNTAQTASKPTAVTSAKNNNKPAVIKTNATGKIYWKWPVTGKILSTFKTKGVVNKGVDIAGSRGVAIKAAASGKVVYAGNGLLGYGNLVIIDHNQQFLSAYAHNSRVLVKENDMVKTGDKIAEMGSSGADRVMLHFEIRRDGKPVDPLRYLPKR